jgi:hypothetical protein
MSNLTDYYIYSIAVNEEYLYQFEHQDHSILGVEPKGHYAYEFSNKFIFVFDSMNDIQYEMLK